MQRTITHFFSLGSSQPAPGSQSKSLSRKRHVDGVEPEARTEAQAKDKGKRRAGAQTVRVYDATDDDTPKKGTFTPGSKNKGGAGRKDKLSALPPLLYGDTTFGPSDKTPTRKGISLIDLTLEDSSVPHPTPSTAQPFQVPTPPSTGMKRANSASSSSAQPRRSPRKRTRLETSLNEREATPAVASRADNVVQLPTPATGTRQSIRRSQRVASRVQTSAIGGSQSSGQSSSDTAHARQRDEDAIMSDPFVDPTPHDPAPSVQRKTASIPFDSALSSTFPHVAGEPALPKTPADDAFKVPAIPLSLSSSSGSSQTEEVESSQWEEQSANVIVPATPRKKHRASLSSTSDRSPAKEEVGTSQLSEMELRIPPSPTSIKKMLPSKLGFGAKIGETSPRSDRAGIVSPMDCDNSTEVPSSQAILDGPTSLWIDRRPLDDIVKSSPTNLGNASGRTSSNLVVTKDLSKGEVVPETPHRGRQNQRTSSSSPRNRKPFDSPASIRQSPSSSRGKLPALSLTPSKPDKSGKTPRSFLFDASQGEEASASPNIAPLRPLIDHILGPQRAPSPHPADNREDDSETEPESSQWRAPTPAKKPESQSSVTEPESSPSRVPTDRGRTPVRAPGSPSSLTEPESPQCHVPTDRARTPAREEETQSSVTEPESPQWRIPSERGRTPVRSPASQSSMTEPESPERPAPTPVKTPGSPSSVTEPESPEQRVATPESLTEPESSPPRVPIRENPHAENSQTEPESPQWRMDMLPPEEPTAASPMHLDEPAIQRDQDVLDELTGDAPPVVMTDVYRRLLAVRRGALAGRQDDEESQALSDTPLSIPFDYTDDNQSDYAGSIGSLPSQVKDFLFSQD